MTEPTKKRQGGGRASRTRQEILAAAEQLFASRGFAATRLEDVADEVGVTRAALFYHFKDKKMLYDATIAYSFGSLDKELHDILDATDKSIAERIELASIAWVDAIIARPALARLILRFVADGYDEAPQAIFWEDQQLPLKFFSLFQEGCERGELTPQHTNPFHAASAVIGTTVFYVGAMETLMPKGLFDPLAPDQVAIHKEEAIRSTRRLLGIPEPLTA